MLVPRRLAQMNYKNMLTKTKIFANSAAFRNILQTFATIHAIFSLRLQLTGKLFHFRTNWSNRFYLNKDFREKKHSNKLKQSILAEQGFPRKKHSNKLKQSILAKQGFPRKRTISFRTRYLMASGKPNSGATSTKNSCFSFSGRRPIIAWKLCDLMPFRSVPKFRT